MNFFFSLYLGRFLYIIAGDNSHRHEGLFMFVISPTMFMQTHNYSLYIAYF